MMTNKKSKLKVRGGNKELKRIKNKVLLPILEKINSTERLNKYYRNIIDRLSVADCISLEMSKEIIDDFIFKNIILAGAVFVILFFFLKTILISFVFAISAVYISGYHKINNISKKMKIIEFKFPEAVQVFYDEYMVSSNVRNSLTHVSDKTKGSIQLLFETMIRRMYSGEDSVAAIDDMAETMNIFYAYAFAEILKLSLTDVGDISKEIGQLIKLMQEDIEEKEKTKSELHENKMMFYVLNAITAVVFIANLFLHPYAKEMYSYTIQGSMILMFWIIQIICGLVFIDLNEKI